ncbi:YkgJ family cysteine cluster protein [uncultured Methanocorpusculum sp.]|nr:YkgJ family cysteine cluster protein [uncultured Methanocorpusculum sp.]
MELEIEIRNAEFACRCCGECCSGKDNEVMVSPDEIDLLCEAAGLTPDQIAEPYPEWIHDQEVTFTFGRVLRRGEDGNCMFLKNNRCTVYEHRPHICRTYPFMLDGNRILVFECSGCKSGEPTQDAELIAQDLLARREAEDKEFLLTKEQYQKHSMVLGSTIIFDSKGAHQHK